MSFLVTLLNERKNKKIASVCRKSLLYNGTDEERSLFVFINLFNIYPVADWLQETKHAHSSLGSHSFDELRL